MQDRYTEVNGRRVRYLESGSGSDVLLLHGLGGYADKWRAVIRLLSTSYHVVAPDMLGSGLSDKPMADYTPGFFVEFVRLFTDVISMERPHVVGASLGGQVASLFAGAHPSHLSKLVLVSPAGMMRHSTPSLDVYVMAALYPRFRSVNNALMLMEGSGNPPHPKLVSSFIKNMMQPNAKMAFMSSLLCFKNAADLEPTLRSVAAPTLLLWGRDDTIIPISYSAHFVKHMPNCKLVEIENCGHTPYVQHPEQFADLVDGFLSDGDHAGH